MGKLINQFSMSEIHSTILSMKKKNKITKHLVLMVYQQNFFKGIFSVLKVALLLRMILNQEITDSLISIVQNVTFFYYLMKFWER